MNAFSLGSLSETVSGYAERAFTPSEVTMRCQRAIADGNSEINAIVHTDEGEALRAARASSRRWSAGAANSGIDGAPLVVKANIAVGGMPWTAALACFSDRLGACDALAVARLRDAGGIIVGIANMDEGALGATTSSEIYGPCQNPLRLGFTPGGSSGGSAAAVAAGFCLGAIGTDTMGSVRIPAAYCGVVGFKPSQLRIPLDGVEPLCPLLDHVGILARRIADVRLLYACLSGEQAVEASALSTLPAGLRIGICAGAASAGKKSIAACLERVSVAMRQHFPAPRQFSFKEGELEGIRRSAFLLCERDLALSLAGAWDRDRLSPAMRAMLDFGARASADRLGRAVQNVQQARDMAADLFADFDALIMPTTPHEAFPHRARAPDDQADFAVLANAAGLPALAVPIGVGEGGLPISLQILTRVGEEHLAMQLGAMLEGLSDH